MHILVSAAAGILGLCVLAAAVAALFLSVGHSVDAARQAVRVRAALLAAARGEEAAAETVALGDGVPLDRIQLVATHNSYRSRGDPIGLFLVGLARPAAVPGLRYGHRPLSEQLDAGIRSVEIDVRRRGGRFVVSHVPFLDDRCRCPDFRLALEELRLWSDRTPGHVPVLVLLELKDDPFCRLPGFRPFDGKGLDLLDAELRDAVPSGGLIVPDDVRKGASTLEAAVLAKGWPTVGESRGRFLFILHRNERLRGLYLGGHPALAGRAMFTCAEPGSPDAAVLLRNDPLDPAAGIRSLVERGYLVRTRADADLVLDPRRFEAALASGAQVVSTDYPPSEPHPSGYVCALPGGLTARIRP